VAVTADGCRVVFSLDDGTVKLWDAASGECLRAFTGHTESVHRVALTPDGQQVISGLRDGTMKLWDAATGEALLAPDAGRKLLPFAGSIPRLADYCRILLPLEGTVEREIWQLPDGEWAVVEPVDVNGTKQMRFVRASAGAWRYCAYADDSDPAGRVLYPAEIFGAFPMEG
jgi:hypothetical protein